MRYMLTLFYPDSSSSSHVFYGADGLADARYEAIGYMEDLMDDEPGAAVIRRILADGGTQIVDRWSNAETL